MKERIDKLIQKLSEERDAVLKQYLDSLDKYEGNKAAEAAGHLHDLDRHITNLHLEIQRMKAEEAVHA